ncbi:MAG: SufE family protein [Hyphomonadaceae bacterium]|nr:SufE family protein [Hyphomonadaceae bacterium]
MSVSTQAAKLREDFAFLDDWEARFAHLIDLGKSLPQLAPHEYDEANKVRGCSSQVWLVAEPSPPESGGSPGAIRFRGASDAMIVSGLVAMLLQLFSDQKPADILAFDADAFFKELGVSDALTPQRSNGLRSMLARIRGIAEAAR